ncbi:MAG: NUDIX hydrolase [Patescibacteria group bacterium]
MKKRPLPPNTKLHSEKAKLVFRGVRFDTYQWQQKQFDGSVATYEMVKRDDTVIVIPIIGEEIVLVNEQQPHWDKPGITLVAGMVNPNEDLVTAARRELEEETGLVFDKYSLVHVETSSPAIEWFAYTFIAHGFKGEKEKKLDPGERNEIVKFSLDQIIEMVKKRELFYRARFIEDMIIQDKLGQLKDLIKNPEKYSIPI